MQTSNHKKEELFNKILSRGLWKDIPEREEKAVMFFHFDLSTFSPTLCLFISISEI